MGKSTKIKRAILAPSPTEPTLERQRRDAFAVVSAPRQPGEQLGRDKLTRTRKRVCRIDRMKADGWLDNRQAAALQRYELLSEQAGYETGRSCLDIRAGGGGTFEGIIDANAAARMLLARARNAVADPAELMFVDMVISPSAGETMINLAGRLLASVGNREQRMARARAIMAGVGEKLAGHFFK